jgi:hypothetical protein
MATPRPLGVRRANVFESIWYMRLTTCTRIAYIWVFESCYVYLGGSGFGSLALASPTLPSPANPQNPEYRVCLFGLGQRRMQGPLGDIILGAVITASRRPGGMHKT